MPRDAPDPFDAVRAAGKAVMALEEEAGIAKAAERARDVFGYDIGSETPFGSRASAEESRQARLYEHDAANRRMRDVYFGVRDLDLRRRLIAANREVDAARHRAAHATVAAARVAVGAAVRDGGALPRAELIGGLLSAGSVWAVCTWANTAAALALLAFLASFLPGAALNLVARRDAAIRAAEEELRTAEEDAEESYSLGPAFTASEERSGEADPRTPA